MKEEIRMKAKKALREQNKVLRENRGKLSVTCLDFIYIFIQYAVLEYG